MKIGTGSGMSLQDDVGGPNIDSLRDFRGACLKHCKSNNFPRAAISGLPATFAWQCHCGNIEMPSGDKDCYAECNTVNEVCFLSTEGEKYTNDYVII